MPPEDRRIKVMVLSASLGKGGTERVFSLLLERFDRSVFAPELAVLTPPIAYPVPPDVQVHVLSERPEPAADIELPIDRAVIARFGAEASWTQLVVGRLVDLVSERRPDVILASPMSAAYFAMSATALFPAGTRLVAVAGGMTSTWLRGRPDREFVHALMRATINSV